MPIEFFTITTTDEYVANMTDDEWFDLMVDCFADETADAEQEM